MNKTFTLLLAVSALLSGGPSLHGETVALLIGNNAYQYAGRLKNPINEVVGIARKFEGQNITYELLKDASHEEMKGGLKRLQSSTQTASVVMIYFSGHGVEANGENYLIPIDANVGTAGDLGDQTTVIP